MGAPKGVWIPRMLLLVICGTTIIFLALATHTACESIRESMQARAFLERLPALPPRLSISLWTPLALLMAQLSLTLLRERWFARGQHRRVRAFWASDLLLSAGMLWCTGFHFNGVLLIGLTNAMVYFSLDGRVAMLSLAPLLIIYVLVDYSLVSPMLPLSSFNSYVDMLPALQRTLVYGAKNLLTSLCDLLAILVAIQIARGQARERKRIAELNEQLTSAADELRLANLQLHDYAERSVEMGKVRERNRLAREIHDTIGHTLTAISTGLQAVRAVLGSDVSRASEQIDRIAEQATLGLTDVRRSVHELRPDALERHSLRDALERMAENLTQSTGTEVLLDIDSVPLGGNEEETIYRIVQESATNAIRHGHATHIRVRVKLLQDHILIEIWDNGEGCLEVEEGFGLSHIRERVESLGGLIMHVGNYAGGFRVCAHFSLRKEA